LALELFAVTSPSECASGSRGQMTEELSCVIPGSARLVFGSELGMKTRNKPKNDPTEDLE
jgi:hypothetical protein